jgi:hypothetical protein
MKTKRTVPEPDYPAILHFVNRSTGAEYVVIAEDGPINEHVIHGYEIGDAIPIDDTGTLPTNKPLHPRD